eukprot:1082376-Prorocentrum_minimum.AAC.1
MLTISVCADIQVTPSKNPPLPPSHVRKPKLLHSGSILQREVEVDHSAISWRKTHIIHLSIVIYSIYHLRRKLLSSARPLLSSRVEEPHRRRVEYPTIGDMLICAICVVSS